MNYLGSKVFVLGSPGRPMHLSWYEGAHRREWQYSCSDVGDEPDAHDRVSSWGSHYLGQVDSIIDRFSWWGIIDR
jgi:hypothetical protein